MTTAVTYSNHLHQTAKCFQYIFTIAIYKHSVAWKCISDLNDVKKTSRTAWFSFSPDGKKVETRKEGCLWMCSGLLNMFLRSSKDGSWRIWRMFVGFRHWKTGRCEVHFNQVNHSNFKPQSVHFCLSLQAVVEAFIPVWKTDLK